MLLSTTAVPAAVPRSEATTPRLVLGGHVIGVVAGLVTYHLLAAGLDVTVAVAPVSIEGLRLAASGVLATVLTAGECSRPTPSTRLRVRRR